MKENTWKTIATIILTVIVASFMVYCYNVSGECAAKGGTLVRGTFSFVCVDNTKVLK